MCFLHGMKVSGMYFDSELGVFIHSIGAMMRGRD